MNLGVRSWHLLSTFYRSCFTRVITGSLIHENSFWIAIIRPCCSCFNQGPVSEGVEFETFEKMFAPPFERTVLTAASASKPGNDEQGLDDARR